MSNYFAIIIADDGKTVRLLGGTQDSACVSLIARTLLLREAARDAQQEEPCAVLEYRKGPPSPAV